MTIRERLIEYRDGDAGLEGFFCYDESRHQPLPAVLISHAWGGRDEFVERKARRLAYHGYASFALDMYGNGRRGSSPEENQSLMEPFMQDRALLSQRINAALAALKALPQVDPRRVAAMGFCFGGLCVLDLARSGAELRGVVSFHGLLKPTGLTAAKILSKILILHGYDDPLAPPQDVLAIAQEFTRAGVDWQLHAYGHTVHSFTNPAANNREMGMLYSDRADRRSWKALLQFLEEVLR
ncbi:carboxymethylenebutenolidase [Steroidobacter denitrificans]|uniref:Carboxymethylenebutenolidase n=1 Tax=Steroidobacter denitrificans TaxID=465721 RepID=A0A127FB98_STEDE|nr:dienelactone hydrolase family protein [Steroidobacter denitrificans]AMN46878.1 carboxymethylenebutenolidase [Steroidobacter denitrificans]